jgi:hypothetical protein
MIRTYVFRVTGFINQVEISAYSFQSALSKLGKKMSGVLQIIEKKKITITLEEIKPYVDE